MKGQNWPSNLLIILVILLLAMKVAAGVGEVAKTFKAIGGLWKADEIGVFISSLEINVDANTAHVVTVPTYTTIVEENVEEYLREKP